MKDRMEWRDNGDSSDAQRRRGRRMTRIKRTLCMYACRIGIVRVRSSHGTSHRIKSIAYGSVGRVVSRVIFAPSLYRIAASH